MLQVSGTFGTLITILVPVLIWGQKDVKIPMPEGWLLKFPSLLMLLSSISFAIGYYPRHEQLRVNVMDEVLKARQRDCFSQAPGRSRIRAILCAPVAASRTRHLDAWSG
jgi:hypothetical protein